MLKFVVILIHTGRGRKPQLSDYWSKEPALQTMFASRLMKLDRFQMILAFFYVNNNTTFTPRGSPQHDPLHKLRPFYDHLVQKFRQMYTPKEEICIDEAMCSWRGRSSFRVYMRDKPVKWGMKLYELCESSSGYVYNLEVMCHQPGVSNKPFDVCRRLLEPVAGIGHTLYVFNYYCNPELADSLVAEDTAVVGTVRTNRVGMPKDLVQQPMATGEMDFRRKNQTLYVRWKDKRDVSMLTTKHLPEMRTATSQSGNVKVKPVCVLDYIGHMSGVDKSEQMIIYLTPHRKTVKWWKKLVLHLMTLVMIQAHCLFNKHQVQQRKKKLKLDQFVRSVCNVLTLLPVLSSDDDTTLLKVLRVALVPLLHPGVTFPGFSQETTGLSLFLRKSARNIHLVKHAKCATRKWYTRRQRHGN